jgi:hypothetical protein
MLEPDLVHQRSLDPYKWTFEIPWGSIPALSPDT